MTLTIISRIQTLFREPQTAAHSSSQQQAHPLHIGRANDSPESPEQKDMMSPDSSATPPGYSIPAFRELVRFVVTILNPSSATADAPLPTESMRTFALSLLQTIVESAVDIVRIDRDLFDLVCDLGAKGVVVVG